MGKLIFIGLGLGDERGITLKGLEVAMACDHVFMESYTSTLSSGSRKRLEDLMDKKIIMLDRESVEGGNVILEKASKEKACLLVPGDSMSATTHQDLRLRAQEMGIETVIIDGVSALTAVPAALGLQIYKFGRTVTIPLPEEKFKPTSFYEKALENFKNGVHTLFLLDIKHAEGKYMTATEGFEVLASVEKELKGGLIAPERLVCVVARAGSDDALVSGGQFSEMAKKDFGSPLHSIVIPGELHFLEVQSLVELAGAPENLFD
jgi:diphthine synthase